MRTGSPDTRLIVLRGNSGSGKTSVARAVRAAYGRGLALVCQDVVRRELPLPHQMREWYQERDLLPDGCETVIGEDSPLDASVRRVLRQA
ncbi:hypothetical protein [Microbispora sp. H10830]|uniref:hypothetical protein n=1 Tax=Microbispora sp. H10830 TaxID=2729109 RepID=UPI001602A868|nr:hypothetical protein [Microbispora sp. H10830]